MSLIQNKRLHFLMERFAVLPFGFGCTSHSSVELGKATEPRKLKIRAATPNPPPEATDDGRTQGRSGMKNSFQFLSQGKHHISNGMQRLIRSIKSFSQIFVYKEDTEEEEKETEMEIGFPTDVKHVTHIGLDGSTTTNNNLSNFHSNAPPPQIASFPSISLKQFELAMAAQTATHQPPHHQLI